MGKIYLNEMNFYAHHGCYEEERKVGTNFRVDLEINYNSEIAERTDDINDTVNYLSVYQVVSDEMKKSSHLIENIAKRILDSIFEKFPEISESRIKVTKLAPPLGGDVRSVTIEIERKK